MKISTAKELGVQIKKEEKNYNIHSLMCLSTQV